MYSLHGRPVTLTPIHAAYILSPFGLQGEAYDVLAQSVSPSGY